MLLQVITMFLRWVRRHPMPGIGCLGKFYIRCLGNRKIRIFGFPKIRIFGNLEVRKSENLDFQIPENPDFRKSDFRKSGKPENPDFRIFRFSGFSENRKTRTRRKTQHRYFPNIKSRKSKCFASISLVCQVKANTAV